MIGHQWHVRYKQVSTGLIALSALVVLAACSSVTIDADTNVENELETGTTVKEELTTIATVPPSALPPVALVDEPTLEQCKKIVSPWRQGSRSLVPSDSPPYVCGNRDLAYEGGDIYVAQMALIDALEKSRIQGCKMPYGAPFPDGQFGPATLDAIQVFQEVIGLYPSGVLDYTTLNELGLVGEYDFCWGEIWPG